jgi:hypothetical protein
VYSTKKDFGSSSGTRGEETRKDVRSVASLIRLPSYQGVKSSQVNIWVSSFLCIRKLFLVFA